VPPRFIVLEGLDGAGTTTMARELVAVLEGRGAPTVGTCQPSPGSIGRAIREHLARRDPRIDAGALALLFAADRLDHIATVIAPALAAGRTVVCDRYVMSSWAYQSGECDPAWVRSINARAPWPDLTLWLDVAAEQAHERVTRRAAATRTPEELYDALEFQRGVASRYAAIADEGLAGLVRIDAGQPADAVLRDIVDACERAGALPVASRP
jgi:dTMP kinase